MAVIWIFSRALFSGLHAQENPTKGDEYYALWAEKCVLIDIVECTPVCCSGLIQTWCHNRLSTAMPRILVLILLLLSTYHFLLSFASALLRLT